MTRAGSGPGPACSDPGPAIPRQAASRSGPAGALSRPWGGIVISPNGVWRVLRRHGLSRGISRLSLVAGYADCFHVGRLAGTTGRVWQYTAIDRRDRSTR